MQEILFKKEIRKVNFQKNACTNLVLCSWMKGKNICIKSADIKAYKIFLASNRENYLQFVI